MPSFSAFFVLVLFLQIFLVRNVGSAPTPIDELEARHEGHSDSDATPSPTSVVASDFQHKNGVEAQKLNAQFKALKATDGCQDGQQACVQSQFGQCVAGKWVLSPCAAGTTCFALPLVNKPGTSLACDSQSDANARFVAAGVQGGPDGFGSPTSTALTATSTSTLDPDGEDDCDEPEPTGTPDNTDDGGDCDQLDPTPTGTGTDDGDDCDGDKGDTPPSDSKTTVTASGLPTLVSNNTVFTRMTVGRRQIFTILTSPSPSPVIATATSSPATAPTVVTLSSSSPSIPPIVPTPTPTVSTTPSVVTPTIAVGTNGIVTVTVVSVSVATVTVTSTPDCGISPPALSSPAAIPSSSAAATIGTSTTSTVGPSTLVTSPSPIPETQPTQTILATTSPTPNLFTSLQAAEPSATGTSSSFGGILFSTQVTTPPTAASSPTGSVNLSELLTATLS